MKSLFALCFCLYVICLAVGCLVSAFRFFVDVGRFHDKEEKFDISSLEDDIENDVEDSVEDVEELVETSSDNFEFVNTIEESEDNSNDSKSRKYNSPIIF